MTSRTPAPNVARNLVADRREQPLSGVRDTDFHLFRNGRFRIATHRANDPIAQAGAGFEQFPVRGRVAHDLRKHDSERRIVKRRLLVQHALHLRVPHASPDPEEEQDHSEKTRACRNPEPPPEKRLVPKPLNEREVLEFFEERSQAR